MIGNALDRVGSWAGDNLERIMTVVIGGFVLLFFVAVGHLIWQATLDPWGPIGSKKYHAAYTTGGYYTTSGDIQVWQPVLQHPERWSITLENGKNITLSEAAFNEAHPGQWYGERQK